MRLTLVSGLALLALAAAPGRVVAQVAASPSISASPTTLVATARLRPPPSERFWLERPAAAPMIQPARGNRRKGEILMIVGAAGIVTGLLAHEDLITIAGAVVGGFGLYLYLEATR